MSFVLLIFLLTTVLASLCSSASNESCSTWFYSTADGQCVCGASLLNLVVCNNETDEVCILSPFCLTSYQQGSNEAVIGSCLYGESHGQAAKGMVGLYNKVDRNISRQDQQLCGYLNREGRLCGHCQHNHFISAYSYDLKCYQCHRGLFSNIILYLVVAYVPLTVFLGAVVVFHIPLTSPRFSMAVLLCQVYSQPESLRVVLQNTRGTEFEVSIRLVAVLYGIWNLDFFRTLIPPICLPLTTIQVIALDYLVAVYPLLLLVCVYGLVRARDRGCRLVVRMWRPFLWCSARIRQQWNARHSIIDAFATFILLSYLKFINTSVDLLIVTKPVNVHGTSVGYFLYYDATVEFMGPQHMPYAILALAVLVLGVMFPLFLLLYPMNWFQVLLNKCHLNSPGLRIFMECFQGYYRDRSDGGWECRYFSAAYPVLRITGSILYILKHDDTFFQTMTIVVLGTAAITVGVRPYKVRYEHYNKLDALLLMSLIGFGASVMLNDFTFDLDQVLPKVLSRFLAGLFALLPLVYFIFLLFKEFKQFINWLKDYCIKRRRGYETLNGYMAPSSLGKYYE